MVTTRNGREASEVIKFRKGLPQGDALCPRLFTVCLNPIAWKISASEGYRLSKPIGTTIIDLLYIDDLKIFAASESKLISVMNSVRAAMENVRLIWNPKKCAVVIESTVEPRLSGLVGTSVKSPDNVESG